MSKMRQPFGTRSGNFNGEEITKMQQRRGVESKSEANGLHFCEMAGGGTAGIG